MLIPKPKVILTKLILSIVFASICDRSRDQDEKNFNQNFECKFGLITYYVEFSIFYNYMNKAFDQILKLG